ncbi:1761_t:CDS:2, partial [Paraglomus brasilianum]
STPILHVEFMLDDLMMVIQYAEYAIPQLIDKHVYQKNPQAVCLLLCLNVSSKNALALRLDRKSGSGIGAGNTMVETDLTTE